MTFKTVLGVSDKHGNACLVPDRGNIFRFSPLCMILPLGLSYMTFIILKYVPFMPTFWRVFLFFSS